MYIFLSMRLILTHQAQNCYENVLFEQILCIPITRFGYLLYKYVIHGWSRENKPRFRLAVFASINAQNKKKNYYYCKKTTLSLQSVYEKRFIYRHLQSLFLRVMLWGTLNTVTEKLFNRGKPLQRFDRTALNISSPNHCNKSRGIPRKCST